MTTLNLTDKQFADIAMIWLFDQIMNPEQTDNEDLKEFLEKHSSKLKTPLMKYYLDSDKQMRERYKRIKGVFDGSDTTNVHQIRISHSEKTLEKEKKKDGIVKKILKKVFMKESIDRKDIEEYVNLYEGKDI